MKVLLEGSVDVDSGDPQHLGKKVSRRSFALSDLNEFTGKRRKDDCPRRTLPTSRVVANFHLSPAWSPFFIVNVECKFHVTIVAEASL